MAGWGYDADVQRTSPPGALPVVLEVRTSRKATYSGLGLGVTLLIGGGILWTQGDKLSHVSPLMFVPLAIFAALGGVRVFRSVRNSGRQATYRIDSQTVQAEGSEGDWTQPVAAYRGIRWRRHLLQSRRRDTPGAKREAEYIEVIELAHDDPARSVPLYSRRTGRIKAAQVLSLARDAFSAGAKGKDAIIARAEAMGDDVRGAELRDIWEGYAKLLGLAAIDARDGAEIVRAAEDLDLSIAEMARTGKISREWDDTPPPRQLQLIRSGDPDDPEKQQLTVVLRAPRMPIAFVGIFLAIGALTFLAGLFQFELGLMVFGALFGAGGWFAYTIDIRRPRKIHLTRTELRYESPNAQRHEFSVALDRIETIAVVQSQAAGTGAAKGLMQRLEGGQILISGDDRDYRIGEGLGADALNWLRGFLVSALANA